MKTNEEMKREYIDNGGNKCPYCGSEQISAYGGMDAEGTQAWEMVMCEECERRWRDVFNLVGIDLEDEL